MKLCGYLSGPLILLHVFPSDLKSEDVDFVDFVDSGCENSQLRTAGKDSQTALTDLTDYFTYFSTLWTPARHPQGAENRFLSQFCQESNKHASCTNSRNLIMDPSSSLSIDGAYLSCKKCNIVDGFAEFGSN